MPDEINYASMREVKQGRYILIDGVPCRVVEVETSAPGKHGAAKMRITGVGVFDNQKRTLLKPSSADIEVPIIVKKRAQVVSLTGASVQLMDLESYETYEIALPEEYKSLKTGDEIEVIEYGENKAISKVHSGG